MAGRADAVDVVVVGAGPAGAAAAIGCAALGLRVTLLERCSLPRDRPWETLHPGVEAPLRELGALDQVRAAGFPRQPGIEVAWDGPARLVPYGSDGDGAWSGFQARRDRFDALLVARARALGVRVEEGSRAVAPVWRDGRVAGVQTRTATLRAARVVDAAGGGHWLARSTGLPLRRRSPRLLARYGYARGACPRRDAWPAMVAGETGWTWTARVGEGRYAWTRLDLGGGPDAAGLGPPAALDGLIAEGRTRSADVTWRAMAHPAGPGYVAVGDAAVVLDPASSHGVLRALLTGAHAARLIAATLAAPHREAELAGAYARFVAAWFARDADALRALYARLPRPPAWVVGEASTAHAAGRRG